MVEDQDILTFEGLENPPGVEVIDQLERLRYTFHTSTEVSPTPIGTSEFHFPVGRAFSICTDEIVLPNVISITIRDKSGKMIAEVGHFDEEKTDDGAYILELSTQIKTYIEVEGPIKVEANLTETRINFEDPETLQVGVRSRHKRPAKTITVTSDPVDTMAAISTFGSALQSTTPERSYPTLRGHPPAVELGTSLEIPRGLERPQTGIRLEVPPTYEAIYPVAPLAYYLGAEVTQGSTPRLVTENGFEHRLDSPHDLETGVQRALKQIFTMDCVTRTEGLYNIDLHARNELEPHVDLDFASLYERPLQEQVETYLDIPYELLEGHVPKWRLTAHVEPTSETIEQLPYVVNDLAIVRISNPAEIETQTTQLTASEEMTRRGVLTRSASESSEPRQRSYIEPTSTDSLEQAWIGDRIPIGASKLTKEAFQNRFDREKEDGDISISIVLNDSRMDEEEDLVNRAYGNREDLPFDVQVNRNLTAGELREVLEQDRSFLHYIGHTEEDGFECTDGKLDAATLDSTSVDAFLLNACNSYQQGLHLIEAGAIGGIVTLNEVINDGAVRIGETVARLLNTGFPLRAALTIARDESILGGQYIVVGDGSMTVTQSASRVPNLLGVDTIGDDFVLEIITYVTDNAGLGSIYRPLLSRNDEFFLSSGSIGEFHTSEEELSGFLQLDEVPVRSNGTLYWSSTIQPSNL